MDEEGKPDSVPEVAIATAREVGEAARDQYDNILMAIRRNPLQAVAVAAGVGFVIALLAR